MQAEEQAAVEKAAAIAEMHRKQQEATEQARGRAAVEQEPNDEERAKNRSRSPTIKGDAALTAAVTHAAQEKQTVDAKRQHIDARGDIPSRFSFA